MHKRRRATFEPDKLTDDAKDNNKRVRSTRSPEIMVIHGGNPVATMEDVAPPEAGKFFLILFMEGGRW